MARDPVDGGNLVGKYRIIGELGSGGMADVFLAVAQGLGGFAKLQVIKRLKPEMIGDADMRTMFLDEARLAARLNHPNVVQTNEVGEDEGRYFIAMEYIEGQSLGRIFYEHAKRNKAPLPLGIHLKIIADFLPGLRYAHGLADFHGVPLNLVHRDVSPQNIMVTYEGVAKLVDFGIAKATTNSNATRTGTFKGKVGYGAPEQVKGLAVDQRTDVYAVGVMIWEAIAGRRMWKGMHEATIIQRVTAGQIPSLREVKPDAPADLLAICDRALAPDAADRYASVAELQTDLDRHLETTNGHVAAHEVGDLVSSLFQGERARVRALIEAKLAALEASPDGPSSIPRMMPETRNSLSGSSPISFTPSAATRTNPSATEAALPPPPANMANRGLLPMMAAAMVVLTGLVVWLLVRPPQVVREAPLAMAAPNTAAVLGVAATPAITGAPIVPPAPAATAVLIHVSASPAGARLFLDDKALPTNPYEASLPIDPGVHRFRAEADGFTSSTESVTLDRDTRLQLALRPRAGKAVPGAGDIPALAPRAREAPKPALDTIP